MTRQTAKYYTINDKGRAEISAFLARYHKRTADQRIDAWVDDAEQGIQSGRDGSPITTIEIRSFDAVSGHTECLTLEGDVFTANDVEE